MSHEPIKILRIYTPLLVKRKTPTDKPEMMLVTSIAEMLEDYTLLLVRIMEELLHHAPVPRQIRSVMQLVVDFASSHSQVLATRQLRQQMERTY
jgi:hypothetical protein